MKTSPALRAFLIILALSLFARAQAAEPQSLTGNWKHQDIGNVEVQGTAKFEGGVFTLKGTLDTWGTNDGFQYVFQPIKGDGQIVARVTAVENTLAHAKGGVMFRESLAAGARHAEAVVTATDGAQFLARTVTDDKTTSAKTGLNKNMFPYWVKLERKGDKFSGYESTDGKQWTLVGSTNIAMKADVLVGLRASSHQKTQLGASTFDHVEITKP